MLTSRRTKFLFFTIFYLLGMFFLEFQKFYGNAFVIIIFLLLVFILNLYVLYPGYKLNDIFYISFQPAMLSLGTILGLLFFPNLNEYFKLILIVISGGLIYISTLTNNLLIAEKVEESSLPLFRVGIIWTQIILIIQSIPVLTILYKANILFVFHSLLIFLYFFLSSILYLHTLMLFYKKEKLSRREFTTICFQMAFLPTISSLATSFISAESFLRATFITSVFMGMVGYARGYIENTINNLLIFQYSLIMLIFLAILFLF